MHHGSAPRTWWVAVVSWTWTQRLRQEHYDRRAVDSIFRRAAEPHHFDGLGDVQLHDGATIPVFFDARQTEDGVAAIRCVSRGPNLPHEGITRVTGTTADGGMFETSGDIVVTTRQWVIRGMSSVFAYCGGFRVSFQPPEAPVSQTSFALANLLLSGLAGTHPATVNVPVGGWHLTIRPVEDYAERLGRLRATGGVTQTAWCDVVPTRGTTTRADVERFMSDLDLGLSLATGTEVRWLNYADSSFRSGFSYFRSARPRPLADLTMAMRWDTRLDGVLPSWSAALRGQEGLEGHVEHLLEACASHTDTTTRGLAAATLLDVLANRHAAASGFSEIVPEDQWLAMIPRVIAVLGELSGTGVDTIDELARNVSGVYRRSFRKRLARLLADLEIPASGSLRNLIVVSRNSLVHEGRFSTQKPWDEYRRLLWAARCCVLRLAGSRDPLPTLD
jgi:hypothetical protein